MTLARSAVAAIVLHGLMMAAAAAQSTDLNRPAERPPGPIVGVSLKPPVAPPAETFALDPAATTPARADAGVAPAEKPATPGRPVAVRPSAPVHRSFAAEGDPKTVAPVVIVRRLGKPVPASAYPRHIRVLPLHVAQKQQRLGAFNVPRGYRPAWEDDRLNPRRAEGTLAGRDAMNAIWTATVPRRLIDGSAARHRAPKPAVVYPYIIERRTGPSVLATRAGDVPARNGAGVGR